MRDEMHSVGLNLSILEQILISLWVFLIFRLADM